MTSMRKRETVVPLREIEAPVPVREGTRWVTLAEAKRLNVRLESALKQIGPRDRGVVYRNQYWFTINTVHEVYVLVERLRNRRNGQYTRLTATMFQIVEENEGDVRVRRHCTSWDWRSYGDKALFTIE